jgi:hypothetical protein
VAANTNCRPSADQDWAYAKPFGPNDVSCCTSLPSGFIVKMSVAPAKAIRPFFPGKVARAGPAEVITRTAAANVTGSELTFFIFIVSLLMLCLFTLVNKLDGG